MEEVYQKLIELGNEVFTVYSLSNVLVECNGVDDNLKNSDRQELIRILSEKTFVLKNKFNDLEIFIGHLLLKK